MVAIANKLLLLGALGLALDRFPFVLQGNCCFNELGWRDGSFYIHTLNHISHITSAGTDILQADF